MGLQCASLFLQKQESLSYKRRPATISSSMRPIPADMLRFFGINVANAAKTAEQLMAVFLFFAIGTLIGTIFVEVAMRRRDKPGNLEGVLAGALFGLPMIAVAVGVGNSALNPVLNILWLLVLFTAWGLALAWSTGRLLAYEFQAQGEEELQRQRILS